LTLFTGLTIVKLFVKYAETSSPRVALSAISSAVGPAAFALDVFGIDLFFLLGRFPGGDQVIVFAFGVVPNFEDDGTHKAATPTYCTELFRIVVLLVDQIGLVKNRLCFL
jgi:hypothetical protein